MFSCQTGRSPWAKSKKAAGGWLGDGFPQRITCTESERAAPGCQQTWDHRQRLKHTRGPRGLRHDPRSSTQRGPGVGDGRHPQGGWAAAPLEAPPSAPPPAAPGSRSECRCPHPPTARPISDPQVISGFPSLCASELGPGSPFGSLGKSLKLGFLTHQRAGSPVPSRRVGVGPPGVVFPVRTTRAGQHQARSDVPASSRGCIRGGAAGARALRRLRLGPRASRLGRRRPGSAKRSPGQRRGPGGRLAGTSLRPRLCLPLRAPGPDAAAAAQRGHPRGPFPRSSQRLLRLRRREGGRARARRARALCWRLTIPPAPYARPKPRPRAAGARSRWRRAPPSPPAGGRGRPGAGRGGEGGERERRRGPGRPRPPPGCI